MEVNNNKFWYVHSCDLNTNIEVKIGCLDGRRDKPAFEELLRDPILKFSGRNEQTCSDMFVECQIFSNGRELTLPVRTSYKSFSTRWNWNEWITLPYRISDLPRNSILTLTVYDYLSPRRIEIIGGTAISFFGEHAVFRQGLHDLKLWPDKKGHPDLISEKMSTHVQGKDQMQRLNKLTNMHKCGQITTVDWLDRLAFREIEVINEQEKRTSNYMYLVVEFPRVEHKNIVYSVVFWEFYGNISQQHNTSSDLVKLQDPGLNLENLQEEKHRRLVRSLRHGHKDDKPNAAIRDDLDKIMNYPPNKILTSDEQDIVWKYRNYLRNKKQALTKFLKCVNWNKKDESEEAIEVMKNWEAPDVDDALELLGPSFTHPAVRSYAVNRLNYATDEDLNMYLLQLVQALKYEAYVSEDVYPVLDTLHYSMESTTSGDTNIDTIFSNMEEALTESRLSSHSNPTLSRSTSVSTTDESKPVPEEMFCQSPPNENPSSITSDLKDSMDLATFLIYRACNNPNLANYLFWYLEVEGESSDSDDSLKNNVKSQEMYMSVMRKFIFALDQGSKEAKLTSLYLRRQKIFVTKLIQLSDLVRKETSNRMKRIEKLQSLLADPEKLETKFTDFEPLPLPLDPRVMIKGIVAEKATLFKSNLEPFCLNFLTTNESLQHYVTIFKHGDDLRQDQLILQTISLMDKILRRESLDLKLSPYKVLATGSKHGFVQFIESNTVAEILKNDGTIQNFFKKYSPSENSPDGINPQVLDNYIKSCAGYCVITYILGIGDRHLDNLLLTKEGNLFHIDFGYILGRDPKPLPPPMKLTKEMVDGMGGVTSDRYNSFRGLCYTAFHQLRRHSNLILNLFSLMVDASVPDIALEPDKTVKKVEDKFRLELDDDGVDNLIRGIIDESVNAVMATLVEQFHKLAQYMRK